MGNADARSFRPGLLLRRVVHMAVLRRLGVRQSPAAIAQRMELQNQA